MLIKETVSGWSVLDYVTGAVLYIAGSYDGALQYCSNNR